MTWTFDQGPEVACVTCQSIFDGAAVLVVTHYDDDDSWAFLDGQSADLSAALVVSMKEIVAAHPSVAEVSDLPPGWTATRSGPEQPWSRRMDEEG
jgi:hypothetical protein